MMDPKPSRRSLLKYGLAASAVLATPSILRAQQTRELTMLTWAGHATPEVIGPFEEAHNLRIRAKEYVGGDQMLAQIAQSPVGTYDVVLADSEYVSQLYQADYIERLDPEDYPLDDFFPEFEKFEGHWYEDGMYAVFLRFGFLGLSHNLDAISAEQARSYRVMWEDSVRNRIGQFDWHLPNFGVMSLIEGNAAAFDLSQEAWDGVQASAMTLRPQVKGFYDYGGTLSALRSGEIVAMPGIGDWITGVLQRDGGNVATTIPEQGGLQWTESLSIGKGSRNQDLAREFIRYMLSPEGQVATATLRAYPAMVPTRGGWALLNELHPAEAARQNMNLVGGNALDEIRAGRIQLRRLPVHQSLETWNDAWVRYKNA
ncbi:MAG: spermidine/putrescine ABC transporter substrate-binding protein [Devosia sp.]|uniref:polyamine ABC transporter substrate-binding protein n=1 Tax=Devosia sp. TaxID=1871048 RepID=UPI0024CAEB7B|nr:spermidine/putrescine ABC transporter substrate-binding protein [Devosia sp.]UYO00196.1 MAG: spermidine/putrescine ABC transporter substrate-binding protein [Devosia sp.]